MVAFSTDDSGQDAKHIVSRREVHTASTRSPAALAYAEMTLGVIILLVGSLILSWSTSRGSRVTVRMRKRLMSSVNG
jgi:hypothetical protein